MFSVFRWPAALPEHSLQLGRKKHAASEEMAAASMQIYSVTQGSVPVKSTVSGASSSLQACITRVLDWFSLLKVCEAEQTYLAIQQV